MDNDGANFQIQDQRKLEEFRKQLLDLSLRNPLLSYRASSRRGLDVVDEDPEQIIRWFVEEGRPLRFHATHAADGGADGGTGSADGDNEEEGVAEDSVTGLGADNPDDSLATPYTAAQLRARLQATAQDARLFAQERGIGALYLTVGMLVWYESPESDIRREAPLLLLPASLTRTSARARWRLERSSEDPGVNCSLAEKLKEFGLDLSSEAAIDDWQGAAEYIAQVRAAVAVVDDPRWSVDERRMSVGFFSFARFLMWKDLDPSRWPEDQQPVQHPVVGGLLGAGFREAPDPLLGGPADLDAARASLAPFAEVMDVDSSQAEVLAQVAAGRNLVVHGPPGTGKSQTITNLIADSIARGKRVLFVAEKMAALTVVARRLEQVGLGPCCLQLHSDKASKKSLAEQLARSWAIGPPQLPASLQGIDSACAETRAGLNAYAEALQAAQAATGLSLTDLIGLASQDAAAHPDLPRLDCAHLGPLDAAARRRWQQELRALAAAVQALAPLPAQHPLQGSARRRVGPDDPEHLRRLATAATSAIAELQSLLRDQARHWGLAMPTTLATARQTLALLQHLAQRPADAALAPDGEQWYSAASDAAVDALLEATEQQQRLRAQVGQQVTQEFWETDLSPARAELAARQGSWFAWLSGSWRAACRQVRSCCRPPAPKSSELLALAQVAVDHARAVTTRREAPASLTTSWGPAWTGPSTPAPVAQLRQASQWLRDLRPHLPSDSRAAQALIATALGQSPSAAEEAATALSTALGRCEEALQACAAFLSLPEEDESAQPWESISERMQARHAAADALSAWAAWLQAGEPLRQRGLQDLLEALADGRIPADALEAHALGQWARSLVAQALDQHPHLAHFDAQQQQTAIAAFRDADAGSIAAQRYRVAELHHAALPLPVAHGKVGALRRLAAPNRRRLPPIRTWMEDAGPVIQRIAPVFLMSPLSIAGYLPPGAVDFDLVIFDEASQVRPADALGAILRARQVVIVGDPKQMPPTAFFESLTNHDEDDDDASGIHDLLDQRSVLDLALSGGMPQTMLRWHYRSRHESLIAVSNSEFYDDQLLIFPAPERSLGLRFRHLPEAWYDRGKTRTNVSEASALVAEAHQRYQHNSALSIGLVALSTAQRSAIERALEAQRRADGDFDRWCESGPEPIFVKNLENVQGDERDVILISIGYGRPAAGSPVPLTFGPVNQEGGERRLNVLFTRARRECLIFANFLPDELRVADSAAEGVRVLHRFLAFAHSGELVQHARPRAPGAAAADTDSPFEACVLATLQRHGHTIDAQVGVCGYRIDLALRDPNNPNRYLLGIECDGARYHSSRWARDRDRLRQQVLESLGWRIERVWSTDWFRARAAAEKRLLAAVDAALASAAAADAGQLPTPRAGPSILSQALRRSDAPSTPRESLTTPYQEARISSSGSAQDPEDLPPGRLQQAISKVVEVESPISEHQLVERILRVICNRITQRRRDLLLSAAAELVRQGSIVQDGSFYLSPAHQQQPESIRPRNRAAVAGHSIDDIHPQELRAARAQAIAEAMGCDDDEATRQALAILGLPNTPKNREGVTAAHD